MTRLSNLVENEIERTLLKENPGHLNGEILLRHAFHVNIWIKVQTEKIRGGRIQVLRPRCAVCPSEHPAYT